MYSKRAACYAECGRLEWDSASGTTRWLENENEWDSTWCVGQVGTSQNDLADPSFKCASDMHGYAGGCARACCDAHCHGVVDSADGICDRTIAFAFLTRDRLPLWDVWAAWFAQCPYGSALPIVHSQASGSVRREVQTQVEVFGGRLVDEDKVIRGNPRWSWKMVEMIFATYRVAGAAKGLNGCEPRWVHLLSETDAPARSCVEVQEMLSWHPGTSHIGLFRDDGGPHWDDQPNDFLPYAHTDEWVTLALPHATRLARDAERLKRKWQAKLSHQQIYNTEWKPDGWKPGAWVGFLPSKYTRRRATRGALKSQ